MDRPGRENSKTELPILPTVKITVKNSEDVRQIWQLSVHPRQRRIPELGETQQLLCVLDIDKEAVPFLTIYGYLLIIKGSR
jgi:hypothetical protein